MPTETEYVRDRLNLFDLMRRYPHWSLRAYARHLDRDPRWVRDWAARLAPFVSQPTYPDLAVFASRSSRPHHSPRRLDPSLQTRICHLRPHLSEKFHRPAGAKTIQAILRDELPAGSPLPCQRTIYNALRRGGVIVPRAKPVHTPLTLPPPMEEWELDFGEIWLGPDEGQFEFLMVVDRGTSRVVYLEASSGYTAETALLAVMQMFILYGMPKRLRFDRDPRLFGSWTRDSYPSPLMCLLRCLGIEDVICPPHRPDLKPFVERTIRTLKSEWLARYSPSTFAEAIELLPGFLTYYHSERPHQGQACNNRTPDEAFPSLPDCAVVPEWLHPDAWVTTIDGRVYQRRVNSNGVIQIDRHIYSLGQAWVGRQVLAQVNAQAREFLIYCGGHLVKTLPMKGLIKDKMSLMAYVERMREEARTVAMRRMLLWEQVGPPF